jgi:CubicO group peptidase (beta-lactamase class C family)
VRSSDMPLKSNSCRRLAMVALLVTLVLGLQAALPAQVRKPAAPATKKVTVKLPEQPAAPQLTTVDVAAFLDGVIPLQLQGADIAGAVVIVVKDGNVLFKKGYGYADVAKKTLVSPDATLFRPGSVSKLFTWTAVMQLVEQGKINLDQDVNTYLDFKIPPKDGKPITMRNLMTHTPGFEEVVQQLFVGRASDLYPIGQYLKEHLPNRVYPAGTLPAYSNYGATLAGYIVQRVSGEPFDDYIEQHIFKPLDMQHSTFRQPLPPAWQPLMSNGYERGSQPAKSFEFVEAVPAGSSSITASDISHFMIAQLQDGQYESTQILRPETARLMHSAQFRLMPQLHAMALGFYEETRNGHRIIGHAGDTEYFHSDLHLVLDANVGFFISYNSAGKGEIGPREAVWEQFLDRYFPYTPAHVPTLATARQDDQAVVGRYISDRRGDTTLLNVLSAIGQEKVTTNPDGTISVSDFKDLNGQPKKFREIEPMLFQEVDGQSRIGFTRDFSGRRLLAVGDYPFMAFQQATWYENSAFNMALIIGTLVVFALTLLLWPVAALIRRHYGQALPFKPHERRLRLLVRVVCIVNLLCLAGFVIFFSAATSDIGMMSPRYNWLLRLIQVVGWLGVAGTLLVLYNAFRSWTAPGRWVWSRIWDALIALSCIGFAWFIIAWHMLSFSLRY